MINTFDSLALMVHPITQLTDDCLGSGMALGSEDEGGLSPSLVKPSTPLVKEIDCIDLDSD